MSPSAPLQSRLQLFAPPYEHFQSIDLSWRAASAPPRGAALIWSLMNGREQIRDYQWLCNRPFGVPLVVILPPAPEIARAMPLLNYVTGLDPRAVLPAGSVSTPERIRSLLAAPPRQLPGVITEYLIRRGLLAAYSPRQEVRQILTFAPQVTSISKLAKRLYTSRRTLGRHFAAQGLPAPSHWLQFARLMHVSVRLQSDSTAAFRIACDAGYPDGFTMSNQMKRLIGCRPTEVRLQLGWEWIVEAWISQEARQGGIDTDRHLKVVHMYLHGELGRGTANVAEHHPGPGYGPNRRITDS